MNGMSARWVRRPWGKLRVHVAGSGPLILALHGLGGSGRYWEGLAHDLAGEATIIAPDMAGFGASDKPAVKYDRGFHLDNLDAVVAAMGLGQPGVVVGHSMGGILGALWAARHVDEVRSLALVASPYPATRTPGREWEARGVRPLVFRALQTVWPLVTLAFRSSLYPRGVVLDYVRHTPSSYWRTAYDLLWEPSVVDELAPLQAAPQRRLLLYARNDRQVPLVAQERWTRLLPGAAVEVMDDGGHQLLLATRFRPLLRWLRVEVTST